MDQKEFEKIYLAFAPRFFKIACGIMQNESDAHDVVQESFLKAYRARKTFRGDSQVQTWLHRIVVNTCYDHFRRKKPLRYMAELPERLFFRPSYLKNENLQVSREAEKIKTALLSLTPRQKMVFTLKVYEELSYKEIASALRIKTGTAKATFFQSVEKVRKILAKEVENGMSEVQEPVT
ncbi:MAG: RNA polymerase sigma factor [Candidatus Ratteibacteria bacterium]